MENIGMKCRRNCWNSGRFLYGSAHTQKCELQTDRRQAIRRRVLWKQSTRKQKNDLKFAEYTRIETEKSQINWCSVHFDQQQQQQKRRKRRRRRRGKCVWTIYEKCFCTFGKNCLLRHGLIRKGAQSAFALMHAEFQQCSTCRTFFFHPFLLNADCVRYFACFFPLHRNNNVW